MLLLLLSGRVSLYGSSWTWMEFAFLKLKIFIYVCAFMCGCPQRPEEGIRLTWDGAVGGCAVLGSSVSGSTQSFWDLSRCFQVKKTLQNPAMKLLFPLHPHYPTPHRLQSWAPAGMVKTEMSPAVPGSMEPRLWGRWWEKASLLISSSWGLKVTYSQGHLSVPHEGCSEDPVPHFIWH